jgi:hypothetical protein
MKNQASKVILSAVSALMLFSVVAAPALAWDHHHHGRQGVYNNNNFGNRGGGRWHGNAFRRHHDGMNPREARDMRWNRRHH